MPTKTWVWTSHNTAKNWVPERIDMRHSEKIAIAAHLHVLLRRKTGRVTDTEWMAKDTAYAMEIVRFARENADKPEHADLAEWADKLEAIVLNLKPVPRTTVPVSTGNNTPPDAAEAPKPSRYIWGIR
jgi:hypothetical protein